MKKILIILGFLFVNFGAYADGHSGKIHLEGFGAWSLNVMNAGNGNLSITYDGLYSGVAMDGTKFGNNSSVQCVGGLTTSKGKFNDETAFAISLFFNILEYANSSVAETSEIFNLNLPDFLSPRKKPISIISLPFSVGNIPRDNPLHDDSKSLYGR